MRRKEEFRRIEDLLKKQELKAAYGIIEGQDQERKRVAEELHDSLGGMLATLRMYSDLMHEQPLSTELRELATRISALSTEAAAETRRIAHDLGAGVLKNFGLAASLRQLCDAIANHKLAVHAFINIPASPDYDLSLHVYRIVQELFTNTLKHARASTIQMEVNVVEEEYLSIIFEDNGVGFDTTKAAGGMGLGNLRSRVELFQGTITIDSAPQRGTTTIIEIPFAHGNEHHHRSTGR